MSVRNSIRDAIRSAIGLVEEVFNPQTLFLSGEQGAWYDPSDLSTLFQDAAGTIPVTGTGQPVGLMLDKRLGLVRGAELASGLTPFSDASGTTTHTESAITTTGSLGGVTLPLTVGNWYALSATGGTSATELSINTANLAINPTARTVIRTTIGDCVFLADKPFLYIRQSGEGTGTVNSLSLRELPGNHATQATAASRPIFRDVGGLRYLECDGVDDGMVTGSIDFTGTGKMFVCAGVRKLSDAATGALLELSSSSGANSGTFALFSPTGALPTYGIRVIGTAGATPSISGIPSPDSSVVSLLGYIADDVSVIRRNGVVGASSSSDLGTGNYGNHPLYLFRRGGTTLPFNGLFYGAIIAGAAYSASQIASAERYLAGKSGVTL